MAIKTFTAGSVLTASDTNTYLSNGGLVACVPTSVAGTGVSLSNATISFSSATSISLNGVFTGNFTNYRLVLTSDSGTTDAVLTLKLRVGGVDTTGATDYGFNLLQAAASGTWSNLSYSAGTNAMSIGYKINTAANRCTTFVDISAPFVAQRTSFTMTGQYGAIPIMGGGFHAQSISYDGFSVIPAAGNVTGSLAVYGYRI